MVKVMALVVVLLVAGSVVCGITGCIQLCNVNSQIHLMYQEGWNDF